MFSVVIALITLGNNLFDLKPEWNPSKMVEFDCQCNYVLDLFFEEY